MITTGARVGAVVLLLLTTLSADATATTERCTVTGTFVGDFPVGERGGLPFVGLGIDGATTDCATGADTRVVTIDPGAPVQVSGVPRLRFGQRYRMEVRSGATLGTHALVAAERADVAASPGLSLPASRPALRKSGNNQPPCTQERWRPEALPVALELHEAGSEDIGPATLEALREAAAAWAGPSCSTAAIDASRTYAERTPLLPDGRSTVEWLEEGGEIFANLGAENIGFTCHVCDEDGYFIEADVRFDGTAHDWSMTCEPDAFDVLGSALHEFGHVLGAPHLEDASAVMFAVTTERRLLSTRMLTRADALYACDNYPCPDGDCSAPVDEPAACVEGAGLCAFCDGDSFCGAAADRCLVEVGVCGRRCSTSFECPEGYACGDDNQCRVVDGFCRDLAAFVGCACTDDSECGGASDRCLDGRCAAACGGGVACPVGAECVMVYDDDGLPDGRHCVASAALPDVCAPVDVRGCGCGSGAPPPTAIGWTFLLVGALRRRRGC